VDGSGIQRIESADLAAKLRNKVNVFNARGAARALAITAAFVVIPEFF